MGLNLKMIKKEYKFNTIILSVGVLLLFISFFVDEAIINAMNYLTNPFFDYIFLWVTLGLFLVFFLLVLTSLFMWEENKKDWIIPTWISFFLTLALTMGLKLIVQRDRPEQSILDLVEMSSYSFPSTHAAVSFSVVPILDRVYPHLKWFWVLFAIAVAFSRLYFKVHFVSDILAGALIGLTIGIAILYVKRKYNWFGASV